MQNTHIYFFNFSVFDMLFMYFLCVMNIDAADKILVDFFLVSQSWYEVHLVAFNKNGESQESVRNIITFSGDNPEAETVEGTQMHYRVYCKLILNILLRYMLNKFFLF